MKEIIRLEDTRNRMLPFVLRKVKYGKGFLMKYNGEYDDIINMPHHVSKKHPQMSLEMRSAQFAPFAALTGYDDQVRETARLTNERKDIAEGLKMILDEKLRDIQAKLYLKPKAAITYFIPDRKKKRWKICNS